MKNIIIFGLSRSGTTYVHRLVTRYLWLKHQKQYSMFNEFFSDTVSKYIGCYVTYNRGGVITNERRRSYMNLGIDSNAQETEQRILDKLNNYDEEFPMMTKLHVDNFIDLPVKQQVYDRLNETSEFILVERNDLLNVVLSLTLARNTGVYNVYGDKKIPKYKRYSVTRDTFIEVFRWKYDYEKYKKSLKNIIGIINFDDMGISGTERVVNNKKITKGRLAQFGYFTNELGALKNLGFDDEKAIRKINFRNMPVKLISNKRKWTLLENKEQALMWNAEIFK